MDSNNLVTSLRFDDEELTSGFLLENNLSNFGGWICVKFSAKGGSSSKEASDLRIRALVPVNIRPSPGIHMSIALIKVSFIPT